MNNASQIGQRFILGFSGHTPPQWLIDFSENYELGGIILFDSPNGRLGNFDSKEELRQLIKNLKGLNGSPLICIDQEGGAVCRLKSRIGFENFASAKTRTQYDNETRLKQLSSVYSELSDLGIDLNFSPCVDLSRNKENPNIAMLDRSFCESPDEVIRFAVEEITTAAKFKVRTCIKHFPGLDSANTDTHLNRTEITITKNDLLPFKKIAPEHPFAATMVSHGINLKWSDLPCSVSRTATERFRTFSASTTLISDDLQMNGVRSIMSLEESCEKSLLAGIDMICLANTTINEEDHMTQIADAIEAKIGHLSSNDEHLRRIANFKSNSLWE